jgi:hypothetical protein
MVPAGPSETILPERDDENDAIARNDAGEELAGGDFF